MNKRTSFMLSKTIFASSFAVAIGLSSQVAEANHDTWLSVSLGGHLTLTPAYISVAYYARHSEEQMPTGWLVPNIMLSLHGASIGVVGLLQSTQGYNSFSGTGPPPFGVEASVIVLTTSTAMGVLSVLEATRITDAQTVKRSSAMPFVLLPSVTTNRQTGTTVSLMAVGSF